MRSSLVYHTPVMVQEVVSGLITDENGVYVDATVGGGGHSSAMLNILGPTATVLGIDRDAESISQVSQLLSTDSRFNLRQGSFSELDRILTECHFDKIHGILYDLGVSSRQIDSPVRGFSYRLDGPLDMRMDNSLPTDAAKFVRSASQDKIANVLRDYGEERNAFSIARALVLRRSSCPIETTGHLREVVESTRPKMLNKTLARVFQAIRIAINNELEQLSDGLNIALRRLDSGGRLATIAYHSLEDRIVKKKMADLIRSCNCPPHLPMCICGGSPEFVKVGTGRFYPSKEEVARNSRARSAVLRIYEKRGSKI